MSPVKLVVRAARTVLTRGEKIQIALLGVLVLFSVALEMLGIGLFIPTLALLTSEAAIADLRKLLPPLVNLSNGEIVVVGMTALVIVFLVKNLLGLAIAWYQRTVMARMSIRLTGDLFERYMRQPYEFHKRANSAVLIRNVQNASLFVSDGIGAITSLVTDGLVAVGIFVILMLVEPVGTPVIVALFAVLAIVVQRTTRNRVAQLGIGRNFHHAQLLRRQQQGLSAVKEVIVSGRRGEFLHDHRGHVEGMFMANRTYGFLQQLPRTWMEVVTIGGFAALVVVVVAQGRNPEDALRVLGLFGIAAFRVQPSLTRMMTSIQALTFVQSVIENFYRDFTMPMAEDGREGAVPQFSRHIEIRDVSFGYEERDTPVLEGVNQRIARGEKIGIVGPSGSGKSTLVDILLGVVPPVQGQIVVDGVPIADGVTSWQRQIGYVPQEIYLLDDTIGRNVAFGAEIDAATTESVWTALADAQLADFVRSLPEGIDTLVGERGVRLSGGQRQRIGIARALMGTPKVLVFDEATSALDATTETGVIDAIRAASLDKTVVVVAHRPSTLVDCDRIWRVAGGTITDLGKPDDDLLRSLASAEE